MNKREAERAIEQRSKWSKVIAAERDLGTMSYELKTLNLPGIGGIALGSPANSKNKVWYNKIVTISKIISDYNCVH